MGSVGILRLGRWVCVRVLCLLLLPIITLAQQDPESIRSAMQGSLDRQRESVRQQVQAATKVNSEARPGEFFTMGWPQPAEGGDCDPLPSRVVNRLVRDAAQREGLDPALVREVARRESGFRPCAVSSRGAMGLMQLMPATAGDLAVADPFDPEQSLAAGSRFLRKMIERYDGDLQSAIAAYNAGPKRVDKAGGPPAIPETQRYLGDILARLGID